MRPERTTKLRAPACRRSIAKGTGESSRRVTKRSSRPKISSARSAAASPACAALAPFADASTRRQSSSSTRNGILALPGGFPQCLARRSDSAYGKRQSWSSAAEMTSRPTKKLPEPDLFASGGDSVVNALSDDLTVEVFRNRQAWRQSYSKGHPTTKLLDAGAAHNKRGTTVKFHPDPEIFGAKAAFRPARLYKMARSKAYLFGGV